MFFLSQKLKALFKKDASKEEFYQELEDILLEADVGGTLSQSIISKLKEAIKQDKTPPLQEAIKEKLKSILLSYVLESPLTPEKDANNIWMFLGVNGAGKTTTIAKIASLYKTSYPNIVLGGADTFRAAAEEQLQFHANALKLKAVCGKMGQDAASVIYDAAASCFSHKAGLLLVDTAGRLHNKDNLIGELKKMSKICQSKASPSSYKNVLVLDSTSGQNAIRQAEVFNQAVKIDSVILTKFDSTSKAGFVLSLCNSLNLSLSYLCSGEGYEAIKQFNKKEFINALTD